MQSSIALHVSVVGSDHIKTKREMQELANKMGIPVTGMVDGKMVCKMPESVRADMPDFMKDIFNG